jgi:hypothetical protein
MSERTIGTITMRGIIITNPEETTSGTTMGIITHPEETTSGTTTMGIITHTEETTSGTTITGIDQYSFPSYLHFS